LGVIIIIIIIIIIMIRVVMTHDYGMVSRHILLKVIIIIIKSS